MFGSARSQDALINDDLPDFHVSERSTVISRKPVKKRARNFGRFDPGRRKMRVKRPLFAGETQSFQSVFQTSLETQKRRAVFQADPEDARMPGKRGKNPRPGDGQRENGSFRGHGPDGFADRRKTGLLDFSEKFHGDVQIPKVRPSNSAGRDRFEFLNEGGNSALNFDR